ncbi:hypothetical protein LINPERPRIM_LOCUS25619 [Linum perenne]
MKKFYTPTNESLAPTEAQKMKLFCHCGVMVVVKMSKTSVNPNRPFYSCCNWSKQGEQGCGFFEWCPSGYSSGSYRDGETSERTTVQQLHTKNTNLKEKNAMLQIRVAALEDKLRNLETTNEAAKAEHESLDDLEKLCERVARLEKLFRSSLNL